MAIELIFKNANSLPFDELIKELNGGYYLDTFEVGSVKFEDFSSPAAPAIKKRRSNEHVILEPPSSIHHAATFKKGVGCRANLFKEDESRIKSKDGNYDKQDIVDHILTRPWIDPHKVDDNKSCKIPENKVIECRHANLLFKDEYDGSQVGRITEEKRSRSMFKDHSCVMIQEINTSSSKNVKSASNSILINKLGSCGKLLKDDGSQVVGRIPAGENKSGSKLPPLSKDLVDHASRIIKETTSSSSSKKRAYFPTTIITSKKEGTDLVGCCSKLLKDDHGPEEVGRKFGSKLPPLLKDLVDHACVIPVRITSSKKRGYIPTTITKNDHSCMIKSVCVSTCLTKKDDEDKKIECSGRKMKNQYDAIESAKKRRRIQVIDPQKPQLNGQRQKKVPLARKLQSRRQSSQLKLDPNMFV